MAVAALVVPVAMTVVGADEPTLSRPCDSYWRLTDDEFAEVVHPGETRTRPLHPIMICNVVTGEPIMAATVVIDRHVTTAGVSLLDRRVLDSEDVAEFKRKAEADRREKYGALTVELYERLAEAKADAQTEVLISLRLPRKPPSSPVQPAPSPMPEIIDGPRPTASAEQLAALAEYHAATEEYEARIVAQTKSFADRISVLGAIVARPEGAGSLVATVPAPLLRELARDPIVERIATRPKPDRMRQLAQ